MTVTQVYKNDCCTGNCKQGRACPLSSPRKQLSHGDLAVAVCAFILGCAVIGWQVVLKAENLFAALAGTACIAAPFVIWFMRVPA